MKTQVGLCIFQDDANGFPISNSRIQKSFGGYLPLRPGDGFRVNGMATMTMFHSIRTEIL